MTESEGPAAHRDHLKWPRVPLKEVATIDREVVRPQEIGDRQWYVGLEHITADGRFEGVAVASEAGIRSNKFVFTEDHVLYGKLRPYLSKIAVPSFSGVCSTDILPIRTGEKLERRFLSHYLRTPHMVAHAASRAVGINLPRLSPRVLESFDVPLPPISEQKRIAALLDATGTLIAKRHSALAELSFLTQAVFSDMFGAYDGRQEPLGQIAHVQSGLQVTSKREIHPIVVPYLRVANVYRGFLKLAEVKTLRVSEKELARTRLVSGDLLVVEGHGNRDEVGRVGVWDGSIDPCVHQNHLIRVRCNPSRLLPRFAEAFMNSGVGRRTLLQAANTTSGLNTISANDVRAVPIPLPALSDQQRFTEIAKCIDRQEVILRLAGDEMDMLLASLQLRAFRGEL